MRVNCNFPTCKNTNKNSPECGFFELPKNLNMSRRWLEFAGYKVDQSIKRNFRLCSDHFHSKDIRQWYPKPLLVHSAVPSLNGRKSENVTNRGDTYVNEKFLARHDDVEAIKSCKLNTSTHGRTEFGVTIWNPLNLFHPSNYKYAIVVLNQPIYWKHDLIYHLWEKAQITITVDGGTNRWITFLGHQAVKVLDGECKKYIPNVIIGDMDSVSSDILNKLKHAGSTVIKMAQQDSTDYTKALYQLGVYNKEKNLSLDGIYVFAETSGRFDHIIGNINTLCKSDKLVEDIQVIQVASNSLTWLLRPGTHKIMIPDILIQHNSWCGLLPIGSSVNCITTTGLKWNLDHASMNFGGLVSTSNTYEGVPEVTVTTDKSTVWTMGIEPLIENVSNDSSS